MFLSDQIIEQYIQEKKIIIGPEFDKKNIRPVGIRIHLSKELLIAEPNQTVDLTTQMELKYKKIDISRKEFYLEPGQFVLAGTHETIQTARNILVILDGRSTVARLGLTTHITASIIDGTFEKPQSIALEIKNVGNFRVRLKPMDPIAMVLFAEIKGSVVQKLQTQYNDMPDKIMPPNLKFRTGEDK